MPLRRPPEKKLSPERQKLFWREYDAGRIKESTKRVLDRTMGTGSRKPVYASPSMMGTVRNFRTRKDMLRHIQKFARTNKIGTQTKFETFEFQPTQILAVDRKNLRTLERVYRAPSVARILDANAETVFGTLSNSHFGRKFLERMQKKRARLQDMQSAVRRALLEIDEKILPKIGFDPSESNILVLDFDPKTKKPLIAIVDHGYSIQLSC
ncbi:MAG: hypothetical protein PHH08_00265 [Candidatus ainarchaeum sp.]|nr:hypothetical protein [Candidatus ainarchaeum sp.]